VAECVAAAEEKGLAGLTFTEHLPLPVQLDEARVYAMAPEELDDYAREVKASAERTSARVLLGIEADWLPGHLEHVTALLALQEWDVVLGSVHFLDDWAFDDPGLMAEWESRDVDAVWEAYFDRLCDAAASGLFDVMAHPDLVKKFGHRPSRDAEYLYDEAARCFAHAGVCAEVSTAGLRKPVGEIYPGEVFAAALVRHEVGLTVGSDAHAPGEVGYAFADALRLLRSSGARSVVHFESREMREVAL
jgi:histidinol-phosphatase (PHP family)